MTQKLQAFRAQNMWVNRFQLIPIRMIDLAFDAIIRITDVLLKQCVWAGTYSAPKRILSSHFGNRSSISTGSNRSGQFMEQPSKSANRNVKTLNG